MVRVYTDEWNSFQFREPTYLDGHFEPHKFDLVKWEYFEPREVLNLDTGKREMVTRSSFTVGTLIWDSKESCFDFHSCGLRYLEYRIDGLEKFILDFCEIMREQLLNEK